MVSFIRDVPMTAHDRYCVVLGAGGEHGIVRGDGVG